MKKIEITNSLTLKEFITQSRYEIPWYQRNYAWESKQLNDLMDDIDASTKDKREHFFGIIMTMPHSSNSLIKRIIDGQQRITTTLIYLKSIEHFFNDNDLKDMNNEHCRKIIQNINDCIMGDMSTVIDQDVENRLKPTEDNKPIFNSIFENQNKDKVDEEFSRQTNWATTNKDLYNAYKYLYKHTSEIHKKADDNEKFYHQIFLRVVQLVQSFRVLPIEVKDQIFAYQFFQTVNDRGNALSITDILKAYFFELSDDDKDKRKKVYDRWNQFTEQLANVEADTFLRHYWLSKIGVVTIKNLLTELKSKYNNYDKAIKFLKTLRDEADNYRILNNFEVSDSREKEALSDIFELAKAFVMPPIFSGYVCLGRDNFLKLTRYITVFVFRYRTICHLENKNMENLFSELAIKIRKEGNNINFEDVKTMLDKLNPADSTFETMFSETKMRKNSVAKYILEKIEKFYRGDRFREWDPKMSVEHILPKNYTLWEKFCSKEEFLPDRYVYRLGNLTLVTQPLNSSMKNSVFETKKAKIEEFSSYKINENVIDKEKWNSDSIENRQKEWGRVASKIWSLSSI